VKDVAQQRFAGRIAVITGVWMPVDFDTLAR
jgi:hypothetical protein